jgi:ABC-type transporter Mla subunit MlaD
LGVLGVQRMQVHRVELQNKVNRDFIDLEQRLDDVRQGVAKGWQQIDELAESASHLVESTLQPLEERLPTPVTQLTTKAREQARDVRTQIRQRVSA